MATGFGNEDGTNIAAFPQVPDAGSTRTLDNVEFAPVSYEGRGDDGDAVFIWTASVIKRWRFVWSGLSKTAMDAIRAYVEQHRWLLYPDTTATATEFRVRQTRWQVFQLGEQYSVELELEEF